MKQKHVGFIIIGIGLLIIVLLLFMKAREDYYINLLIQEQGGSCFLDDGTCLHEDRNFFNYIFGSILSVALIIFGLYVSFFKKETEQKKDVKEFKKKSESLEPDERTVFDKVIEAQGTIFQSELVEKTGYTKVKVTRILDRLEGKGLIERKRRGMTNVVILKS